MHISQFPQETQDFIYELCFKAITRAIKEGKYPKTNNPDYIDSERKGEKDDLSPAN
jgi:hypothetical protein